MNVHSLHVAPVEHFGVALIRAPDHIQHMIDCLIDFVLQLGTFDVHQFESNAVVVRVVAAAAAAFVFAVVVGLKDRILVAASFHSS